MSRRAIGALTVAALVAALAVVVFARSRDCEQRLAIDGDGFTVSSTADGTEVIASSNEDFHVGALNWTLQIGDVQLTRSSYPNFDLKTLAFPIPDDTIALLADGDPVSISYGGFAKTEPAATARARLRVTEKC